MVNSSCVGLGCIININRESKAFATQESERVQTMKVKIKLYATLALVMRYAGLHKSYLPFLCIYTFLILLLVVFGVRREHCGHH